MSETNVDTEKQEEPKNETTEVLKEIRDRLDKKEEPKNEAPKFTREQIREQLKAETGMTDNQLDFHERSVRSTVISAVAPLQEKVAWAELKEEVGKIDPEIKSIMDEELKQYPPERRGDAVLLKKVYKMSLGELAIKGKIPARETSVDRDVDEQVVSRRVVETHPSATGLSTSASKGKKFSDEERQQMRKFNMTEEEWESSRSTIDVSKVGRKR